MRAEYEAITYDRLKDVKIHVVEIKRVAYHEHKDFEVLAVTRGALTVTMRGGNFVLSEGGFAVFSPRMAHGLSANSETASAVMVQFSPYLCREYYPHARRMHFPEANAARALDDMTRLTIFNHICETARHYFEEDRLFELRSVKYVIELILMLAENLPCEYLNPEQHHNLVTRDSKLDAIIEYLETKYQHRLRLAEIAAVAGLRPAYLSHFFSAHMGLSIREYITNLRFHHALRQIDRDLSLSDIAEGSGFSDIKYMTREFVRRTGHTPAQYRELLRSPDADTR